MTDTLDAPAERPLSPLLDKVRWRFQPYHNGLSPVLPAARRFFSDVINHRALGIQPYWLTILGPSGVGKTLALRQLFGLLAANEHEWPIKIDDGGSERFAQCAHIIPGQDLSDWQAPRDYGKYDLIYIEDIGAGAYGDKGAGAVLTSRIVELLQYRSGRWTLLDANLSRKTIAQQLDPRIASRLKRDGSRLIELPSTIPDFNDRKP